MFARKAGRIEVVEYSELEPTEAAAVQGGARILLYTDIKLALTAMVFSPSGLFDHQDEPLRWKSAYQQCFRSMSCLRQSVRRCVETKTRNRQWKLLESQVRGATAGGSPVATLGGGCSPLEAVQVTIHPYSMIESMSVTGLRSEVEWQREGV